MPKKVKNIESGMFFRRLPFTRFVRQVIQDVPEPDVHVSGAAMAGVQEITEEYLSGLMANSKYAIVHAGRETLRIKDIELVRHIKCRPSVVDEEERPSRVRPHRVEDVATMTKKKKILKDNEGAVSVPGIQRAAIKAGIERVGDECYPHCIGVIKKFLEELLKDSVVSAKYNRRYTIKESDVLDAVNRHTAL